MFGILLLVAMLVLSVLVVSNVSSSRGVDFVLEIPDDAGDVEGENFEEIENDTDILSVKSSLEGENIIFEMTVAGTIDYNITSGNRRYAFYMDINDDGYPDWMVMVASSVDDASLKNNEDNEDENYVSYKLTYDNYEGQDNDTLKIWFPKSNITDVEAITAWDISGETKHDNGSESSAMDYAPNDEFSMNWGKEPQLDPAKETPTDTSISIEITSTAFAREEVGENVSFDVNITGTTSGVDHCGIVMVEYYLGDVYGDFEWTKGEIDMEDFPDEQKQFFEELGLTEYYFKSTSENWKTWEYKMSGVMDNSEDDTDKTVIYVRCYKNAEETLWNQISEDMPTDGDGGDGGDGDGFEENWTWIFTGNSVEAYTDLKPTEKVKGTFKLDTAKSPKHIEVTIIKFPENPAYEGETALGIYKLNGNSLIFIFSEPGSTTRPTTFISDYDPVWDLVKTKSGTGGTEIEGTWAEGDGEEIPGTTLGPFKSEDDKPISGATVKVDPPSQAAYSATTDTSGYATFSEEIPAGNYTCKVEKDGKTLIDTNLSLATDGTPSYDGASAPPPSTYSSSDIGDGGDDEKKEEEKGFLLGFEAMVLLAALGVILSMYRRKKN